MLAYHRRAPETAWQDLTDPVDVHVDGVLDATFTARDDAEAHAVSLRAAGARNVTINPEKA